MPIANIKRYSPTLIISLLITVIGFSTEVYSQQNTAAHIVEISPQTTYITAPLASDGYPDYLHYLNNKYGRDIRHEDNAAITFIKLFGINAFYNRVEPKSIKAIHDLLDVTETLPIDSSWVSLENPKKIRTAKARLKRLQPPYLDDELKQWLKANRLILDRVIKASHKPHFYLPWVVSHTSWWSKMGAPNADVSLALAYRALWHLQQGDVDQCIEHLMALQRLGRLFMSESDILFWVIGAEAVEYSNTLLVQLSNSAQLSSRKVAQIRGMFEHLPPPSTLESHFEANRVTGLGALLSGVKEAEKTLIDSDAAESPLDFNILLKHLNHYEDKTRTAFTHADPRARFSAFSALWAYFDKEQQRFEDNQKLWQERRAKIKLLPDLKSAPEATKIQKLKAFFPELDFNDAPTALTQIFTQQMFFANFSIPHPRRWNKREMTLFSSVQMTQVSLALAQYRHDQGEYPDALSQLAEHGYHTPTADLLSQNELIYWPTYVGYSLYSVGLNRIDNGGSKRSDILTLVSFDKP